MFIRYDEPKLDPMKPSCLCAICDDVVQLYEVAIATHRSHGMEVAYLCHEWCLQNIDEFDEEDDDEDSC